MHHYRLSLHGPADAVSSCLLDLHDAGAERVPDEELVTVVWATTVPPIGLLTLSGRHPRARIGSEHFESFGTVLTHGLIEAGEQIVLERIELDGCRCPGCVLLAPEEHGGDDWADRPWLDLARVRSAAERVGRLRCGAEPEGSETDHPAPLLLADALGHLAEMVWLTPPPPPAGPGPCMIEALEGLAATALSVETPDDEPGLATTTTVVAHERAWRLAEAVDGARCRSIAPAQDSWRHWLLRVLGAGGSALEACAGASFRAGEQRTPVLYEHLPSPEEEQALALGCLVSTCLAALAALDAAWAEA